MTNTLNMDLEKREVSFFFFMISLQMSFWSEAVLGNLVFEVHHKFKGQENAPLREMIEDDTLRHGRSLSAVDAQFGGYWRPVNTGLYFTKIGLGTPAKEYYVHVDTGSDMFWVNCDGCKNCPRKSDTGRKYNTYNVENSETGIMIGCDDPFCVSENDGCKPAGCNSGKHCSFNATYGNRTTSASGYYVKDNVFLNQLIGNQKTKQMDGSVVFGCGTGRYGDLASSAGALDGVIGFGRGNSTLIMQLASAKKTLKTFSHCIDRQKGGGIFAIGELVEPEVEFTPLIQYSPRYDAMLTELSVGGDYIEIPTGMVNNLYKRGVTIDSGTNLAYLPDVLYNRVMRKIMAFQPDLQIRTFDRKYSCFQFRGNVNDGFPSVMFRFIGTLNMTVRPHEYLFKTNDTEYCIGWQKSSDHFENGRNITILGALVLSDRLVMYDIERHAIGWTKYNCASRFKVRDETSRAVYSVGYHNINLPSSAAITLIHGRVLTCLVTLIAVFHNFCDLDCRRI